MSTAGLTARRCVGLALSAGAMVVSGCSAGVGEGIGRVAGAAVLELFSRISIYVAIGTVVADAMVVSYLLAKDKQKARLQFWVPFALLACVFLSGTWRFAFMAGVPPYHRLRWIFIVVSIVFVFAVPVIEAVAGRSKAQDGHP